MAKLNENARVAPPFMHAFRQAFEEKDARKELDLRDQSGERVIASRRNSARLPVNETTLRRELAEDLNALLNTIRLSSAEDISAFPYAARSILNYGLTDITSHSVEESAVEDIIAELRRVLAEYEPRLVGPSIVVERDASVESSTMKVRFTVQAEMHATPVDVPVEFVAELELDSGKIRVPRV
jgi:type VI secretion system protein ImpF